MSKKPIIESSSPIMETSCQEEFQQLSKKEQNYAYYHYQAGWEGSKINYFQKSFESPALFTILQLVFTPNVSKTKESCLKAGISEEEWAQIAVYCCTFFNNCGNYKSFGDTKFIPEVSEEVFYKFIQSAPSYANNQKLIDELWNRIKEAIFQYTDHYQKIGFPDQNGRSGFYTSNMKSEEIKDIDEFLQIINVSPLNTRVVKQQDNCFLVLVASANLSKPKVHYYKDRKITVQTGDYSNISRKISQNLEKAIAFAANLDQEKMLVDYVDHFNTGDMETHKNSQRHWVKDIGPVIETNIGFIETYLDPLQVRAEWEGFVALVDKKLSERIGKMVSFAESLLSNMPWPAEFEKDKFLKPDFTSLSILSFSSSGTPLGINIPNYDDIRQNEGFKNVYLANCLPQPKSINYLSDQDANTYIKHFKQIMFLKVTYHELLGHGCGKLFVENEKGFNFDREKTINPLTGKPVTSWYKANETWNQKFGSLNNPYEECRADSVAVFFSCLREPAEILIPEHMEHYEEIMAGCWIDFVYSGIAALEYFLPDQKKWGQAHMRGRFVILSVFLEAGNNFVVIDKCEKDGKDWISIKFDRSQIRTTGLAAMKKFLTSLQVYKATADVENGTKFFDGYSQVSEKFLQIREIVIANKKPRRLELQGHLQKEGDEIKYQKFDENFEGVISSYMARYPYFDQEMLNLWKEYHYLY